MIHFLKLKFAASGYPKEYSANAEAHNQFLKILREVDGISLTPEEIHDPPNASLKTLAKYLIKYIFSQQYIHTHFCSHFQRFMG